MMIGVKVGAAVFVPLVPIVVPKPTPPTDSTVVVIVPEAVTWPATVGSVEWLFTTISPSQRTFCTVRAFVQRRGKLMLWPELTRGRVQELEEPVQSAAAPSEYLPISKVIVIVLTKLVPAAPE